MYQYAANPTAWVDPLGLATFKTVDFNGSDGLYPVGEGQKNVVKIQLQGGRYQDFKMANQTAGIGNFGNSTPEGYTWHHVYDYDPVTNTSTMQLVRTDVHEATVPHQGSVKQFEDHHGVEYESKEAKMAAKNANQAASTKNVNRLKNKVLL